MYKKKALLACKQITHAGADLTHDITLSQSPSLWVCYSDRQGHKFRDYFLRETSKSLANSLFYCQ